MVQSSSFSVEEKPRMCNFKLESAMLENHVPTSYTVHERNVHRNARMGIWASSMLALLSIHLFNTNVQEDYGGTLEIEGLITGWVGNLIFLASKKLNTSPRLFDYLQMRI